MGQFHKASVRDNLHKQAMAEQGHTRSLSSKLNVIQRKVRSSDKCKG